MTTPARDTKDHDAPADHTPAPLGPRRTALVALVLLNLLVATVGIATAVQILFGPDEEDHLAYLTYVAEDGELPDPRRTDLLQVQNHPPLAYAAYAVALRALVAVDRALPGEHDPEADPWRALGRVSRFRPQASMLQALGLEGFQVPPEGFASRTLAGRAWPIWGLRGVAILLGLTSALLLLSCLRHLFPRDPDLAVAGWAATILLTQFVMAFAFISNDPWLILFGLLAARAIIVAWRRDALHDVRRLVPVSALLGLAFLTKSLAIGPAAFVFAFVLLAPARQPGLAPRLRAAAVLAAGPLLLAAWWYLRQTILTGDPVGVGRVADFKPGMFALFEATPTRPLGFFSSLLETFFGAFGAGETDAWPLQTIVQAAFPLVAAAGLVLGRRRASAWWREREPERPATVAAVLALIVVVVGLLWVEQHYRARHGRYLVGSMLPFALLQIVGLGRLAGRRVVALLVLIAVVAALSLHLTVFVNVLAFETIPAAKFERGRIARYVDCGHARFDVGFEGGTSATWQDERAHRARHSIRGSMTPLRYRFAGLDPERPWQVRVRYPSIRSQAMESERGRSAIVMRADGELLHGAWNIWGWHDDETHPLSRAVTADGAFALDWRGDEGPTPIAVAEIWVEEAWVQIEGAITRDGDGVRATVRNVDDEAAHRAVLTLVDEAGVAATAGAVVEPGGTAAFTLAPERPLGAGARLRLGCEAWSLWSDRKALDLAPPEIPRLGDPDLVDLDVLRVERGAEPRTVARLDEGALGAGPLEVVVSWPRRAGDPFASGALAIVAAHGSVETPGEPAPGPHRQPTGARRFAARADAAGRLAFELVVMPGEGQVALDRVQVSRPPSADAPGYDHPLPPSR